MIPSTMGTVSKIEDIAEKASKKNDRQLLIMTVIALVAVLICAVVFIGKKQLEMSDRFLEATVNMTKVVEKNSLLVEQNTVAMKENRDALVEFRAMRRESIRNASQPRTEGP